MFASMFPLRKLLIRSTTSVHAKAETDHKPRSNTTLQSPNPCLSHSTQPSSLWAFHLAAKGTAGIMLHATLISSATVGITHAVPVDGALGM